MRFAEIQNSLLYFLNPRRHCFLSVVVIYTSSFLSTSALFFFKMKLFPMPTFSKERNKIVDKKVPLKFGYTKEHVKFYSFVFVICLVFIVMVCLQFVMNSSNVFYVLKIDTDKILHNTNERFLSVALDSSIIRKRWRNFDMKSRALTTLVSALSPAYLRLGGTASDCLIFNSNLTEEKSIHIPFDGGLCNYESTECESYHHNFTMTKKDWLDINKFTKMAGLDLLFDLNVLLRDGESWDPTNALEIIRFSHENGLNLSWQLGNEPNSFEYVFQRKVTGTQLAKDFIVLRNILNEIYGTHVMLVGPDITNPRLPRFKSVLYLRDFLKEIKRKGEGIVDATTWHHYYLNGKDSDVADFINPDNFNVFPLQMQLVIDTVMQISPELPIWLTETCDAYGGGSPGITDRFVGGFMWLDKLGLAATYGLQVVTRQSIFGGYYSLIDKDLQPLPDFWVCVLHKKLVGTKVLKVKLDSEKVLRGQLNIKPKSNGNGETHEGRTLRFYSHCTPEGSLQQNESAITIFGLNIGQQSHIVEIKGIEDAYYRDAYILTGENGLQSRYSLLNGNRLEVDKNGNIPVFHPVVEKTKSPISLPPYSMGFWVYHGVRNSVCDSGKNAF